ncbi:MAG: hypothetical protein HRT35_12865 [Algicola sp.]|nr:hypothetical protein [Algicola sp.]
MQKKTAETITKTIPAMLKNTLGYFKDSLGKNAEAALDDASGTAGIIIKLFGQTAIDNYFETKQEQKLVDFGFQTYLAAGFIQGIASLEHIAADLDRTVSKSTADIIDVMSKMVSLQYRTFNPRCNQTVSKAF